MNKAARSSLIWVILGLSVALVTTNAAFSVQQRTGGPLIGLAFYAALLILVWRGQPRNHRVVIMGGLVGLAVHVVEVVMMGWSAYPLLMGLNLSLAAGLASVGWLADRHARQENGGM